MKKKQEKQNNVWRGGGVCVWSGKGEKMENNEISFIQQGT
jgi:nitrous oxidase accessory protein NosD